jgi:hypothetical protein
MNVGSVFAQRVQFATDETSSPFVMFPLPRCRRLSDGDSRVSPLRLPAVFLSPVVSLIRKT